ncbi:MAG: XTP/dITP diphosphohydrolase [Bacteroidia bacterium]|jgi:XTP/dITP diphosphohydrolase
MKLKEILFATHNKNKAIEIQKLLGHEFTVKTLVDVGFNDEIVETETTLKGNALLKSSVIHKRFSCNVFSDDTGLEVDALNGAPGVFSARYAGLQKSNDDNMALLLKNISPFTNKNARFKTIISLFWNNKHHFFEGIVEGKIIDKKRGGWGFGYDPIFIPEGYDLTFAEMSATEKNKISHRGKAVTKLVDFLSIC